MSTFPRRVKLHPPASVAKPLLTRTTSEEFDAGINSSAAWTEHLERALDSLSLSGDENDGPSVDGDPHDKDGDETPAHVEGREEYMRLASTIARGRPARVLYDFAGQPQLRELCVRAGEVLEILEEVVTLADGWSLVRIPLDVGDDNDEDRGGEVGLVPRSYYAFTTEFLCTPDEGDGSDRVQEGNALTPRASVMLTVPSAEPFDPPPLVPQNTGEWFRQQLQRAGGRRSLLGGRSLNRFSRFVTSGAEEFVLHGARSLPPDSRRVHTQESSTDAGLPHALEWRFSTYAGLGHGREASAASSVGGEAEEDPDTHVVDVGPVWRSRVPPFSVRVHSPEKRTSGGGGGAYTVYSVTSIFPPPEPEPAAGEGSDLEPEPGADENGTEGVPQTSVTTITVARRFSHFVWLHGALAARLPGVTLPPLPEKQYAGRFSAVFVDARRGELERYLAHVVRHPIARYADALTFFLGCENDLEWRRQLPHHFQTPPVGSSFFAHVYHPAFHFDAEDAEDTVKRFEKHTHAVGRGVQQLRRTFSKVRSARVEMSSAERLLSYSILSLITSTPLDSDSIYDEDEDDEEDGHAQSPNGPTSSRTSGSRRRKEGLLDADGAWCWKEDCADCLRLTKCMQKTAETLQGVADLYDDHARRTMLATEDSFKDVAHPDAIYFPAVDIHKATLSRYKEASDSAQGDKDEDVAARCETVLNTTMAEFEVYHAQKKEDFERITKRYLDDEISFYEKVISRLQTTRELFDALPDELDLTMPGARVPSVYERDLADPRPRLAPPPLPQPCPHVLDAAPMRPVSAALYGGVGFLFGAKEGQPDADGTKNGSGSVFSRFW